MDDADKPADAHPPLKTPVYILPISARLILGMNRTFKAAVTGLMLTVCFAGPVAAGPFEDAVAARDKMDFATALSLLRPLAEQGSANAQFNLGFMYENGQGVPQDDAAAMSWYRKAAEQGFAMAQLGLGVMYVDGRGGVPQDYDTAVSWYRKAAEQGNALGQLGLGLMYASGRGVPQDYVTAHMWLNLAAGSGDKVAAEGRERLAQQMTPAQIAEAQKLAASGGRHQLPLSVRPPHRDPSVCELALSVLDQFGLDHPPVRELKAQGMRPVDIAKVFKIGRASVYRVLGQAST